MKLKLLKLILICITCGACSTSIDNKEKNIIADSLEQTLPSVKLKIDTSKEKTPKHINVNKDYSASLDSLKEFSITLKIKSKSLEENIPNYITSFTIQNAIQAHSEEATKSIMVIFLKQLLYHLKCCNQSYEYDIRSKKATASKVMVDDFFYNVYPRKSRPSSWVPYSWIIETNFGKDNEIIQQLLIDIQKEKDRIHNMFVESRMKNRL